MRERILRLNPNHKQGERIRGYHPNRRRRWPFDSFIGKADFIRRYGREAWAAIPHFFVAHDGHRKIIAMEHVMDEVWTIPPAHPLRRARCVGKGMNRQWLIPTA